MAKLSIILPSYNHSEFLLDRLESIKNQSYKDWEAIIIDDKSTDNSIEIIRKFINENPDFNVKSLIVNEENSGSGYNSWKKGIELATTEYIWIAETDDFSASSFLEESVTILDKNDEVALVFCGSNYLIDNKISYTSENRTKDLEVDFDKYKILSNTAFFQRMPFNTYITNGSSVVFRRPKSVIPDILFTYRQSSDIFLWSYLLRNNSFAFLNKNLNFFRRHEGSTSIFLQKNKLETIYHEKAAYLNFFEQTAKYKQFIDHYIKYYIWPNKADFLNFSSIKKIQINKYLGLIYFCRLSMFFCSKLFKR